MLSDANLTFALGIDVGAEQCSLAIVRPDKSLLGKPLDFPNSAEGFDFVQRKINTLAVPIEQICIGLEATGPYWENLYHHLHKQGYQTLLLHPGQTRQFALRRGLRAKTDRLDATTIARLVLSGDARPPYVPSAEVASYRELVRRHSNLSTQAARCKNEIQSVLELLFPEFSEVFADPTTVSATGLLLQFPSACAIAAAGVDKIAARLIELAPKRYGMRTAARLVTLAENSVASGVARKARECSLRILPEQLNAARTHMQEVEQGINELLQTDPAAERLRAVPEFGVKTVAMLRAELGDVERFDSAEQVIAYCGMDPSVRQSGKWRGSSKISKRGSGEVRQLLYLAALRSISRGNSPYAEYYSHLVGRGLAKMSALMAVMRKMLLVAYRLLKGGGSYDPAKVWSGSKQQSQPTQEAQTAA